MWPAGRRVPEKLAPVTGHANLGPCPRLTALRPRNNLESMSPASIMRRSRRLRRAPSECRSLLLVAAALATSLTGACVDGATPETVGVSTRDSAGVEIAELQADPWRTSPWATLDTAAVMRIRPDDARPETLFGRVRGVLRLSDGRVAVLDMGRHQLSLFEQDGSYIRSIGREGQGPGELADPWRLIRARADTVGVFDMAGHLELLPTTGEGSRRMPLPRGSDAGTAQILGAFESGGYLAIVNEFPGKPQPGTNPLFSTLHVVTDAGASGPTLGRHQSTEFTFRAGSDGRLIQVGTMFWAEPGMAVLPAGYVWCLATEFDCQIRSNTGVHLRTIRAPVTTPPVTDADVEELRAMRLSAAATKADSTRVELDMAHADRMDRFPVMSLIRTDTRGRIWMRSFTWRPSDHTAPWLVLEPDGHVLGTVAMPAGLQVFDIGPDYVLGVDRDADDAEGIVMYAYRPVR
jgi:hypothetical protein